mmetsp:Transcript_69719/g.145371  ORF Transcript_69719/g.145371 Transcript_69719/m.145371 type:complete len:124 (-) Transcript_69719:178-549(-)
MGGIFSSDADCCYRDKGKVRRITTGYTEDSDTFDGKMREWNPMARSASREELARASSVGISRRTSSGNRFSPDTKRTEPVIYRPIQHRSKEDVAKEALSNQEAALARMKKLNEASARDVTSGQ